MNKPPPPAVSHIINSYPRYLAAINQAQAAVHALKSEAATLMRCAEYATPWQWDAFHRHSERDLALRTIDDLIDESLKALAHNGRAPQLDRYSRHCFIEKHDILADVRAPNLMKVWELLSEMFGGDRGKADVNRRIANSIRSALNLYPHSCRSSHVSPAYPRPQIEKGGVLFHLSTTVEAPGYGVRSYHIDRTVFTSFLQLEEHLSEAAGSPVLGGLMNVLRLQQDKPLKLPFRTHSEDVRLCLFTSKTTLWLPMNKAMNIKAFVDEWAPLTQPQNQEAEA